MSLTFSLEGSTKNNPVLPNMALYVESGLLPPEEMCVAGEEFGNFFNQLEYPLVVLVSDTKDIATLKRKIQKVNGCMENLSVSTGISYRSIKDILFIPYDAPNNKVKIKELLKYYAEKDENGKYTKGGDGNFVYDKKLLALIDNLKYLQYNHFSSVIVEIFKKILQVFPQLGSIIKIDKLEGLSRSVSQFSDKSRYVNAVSNLNLQEQQKLPKHVKTKLLPVINLESISSFHDLQTFFGQELCAFFVKHAQGSGGHLASLITENNFEEKWASLIKEFQESGLDKTRSSFLVQEVLEPLLSADLPSRFGITFYISTGGEAQIESIQTQTYQNEDRDSFFGSFYSKENDLAIRKEIREKLLNFGNFVFKNFGLYGTFNIDMMLDSKGEPVSIYDLNPRATGAFSMLAIKKFLEKNGVDVTNCMNLGYGGGRFDFGTENINEITEKLKESSILFTREEPVGVFLLPSIFPKEGGVGFDVFIVNVAKEEIDKYYKKLLDLVSNPGKVGPQNLIF